MNTHMLSKFYLFLFFLVSCCSATDTINFTSPLEYNDTLVSSGRKFQLGFFSPIKGLVESPTYVGIWYTSDPHTVVWVANRDNPVSSGSGGVLRITQDGNVKLFDSENRTCWSSGLSSTSSSASNLTLKLLDSGNLVLSQENYVTLWQSFEHPTDTFLPGMKMDAKFMLTSWKAEANPEPGEFIFQRDQERNNHYMTLKNSIPFWKTQVSDKFVRPDDRLQVVSYLLTNLTTYSSLRSDLSSSMAHNSLINYSSLINNINISKPIYYSRMRVVLNWNGTVQLFLNENETSPYKWLEPRDQCSLFNACGNFSSCNTENIHACKCLPGFKPKSKEKWNSGDFSLGCSRMSPICSSGGANITTFLNLTNMKVGNADVEYVEYARLNGSTECSEKCISNCDCQAFSYIEPENRAGTARCLIWTKELNNIQEHYDGGRSLQLRVMLSDIENLKRSCKTCGTNIVPYPLATRGNCGDPLYQHFTCDNATGDLSCLKSNISCRVSRIDKESRTIFIQVEDTVNCASDDTIREFLDFPPSFVPKGCNPEKYMLDPLFEKKGLKEVEIEWNLPFEPVCNLPTECIDWPNSTCTGNGTKKCICNNNFQWDGNVLDCISANGQAKYTKKEWPFYQILLGVIAAFALLSALYLFYERTRRRRREIIAQENRQTIHENVVIRLYDSERQVKDFIDSGRFREDEKKGLDVPFIDLECILAATDGFSDNNKLGQGGFGPVYKGKFPGGQEIAIKRLCSGSGQGLEEFKNEVILIAKLQHRNLVRLLGYCVEGNEKMLLYEYMPNKSLDAFIFDRNRCAVLQWELRFNIIMGIARGLLYLHQDSRLRIIHRDLKTSNVLLDEDMNPKISDFGLARIFGGKQTEASTERVVGTYGYMSPEYALDGFFSIKSDVYSFGVVVLEIVSGRKNTSFYNSDKGFRLLGHAWRLWKEGRCMEIMEEALVEKSKRDNNEVERCVKVGLLCVQEYAKDRPTMADVVLMLATENATALPTPNQPAFLSKNYSVSSASSSKTETTSDCDFTITNSLQLGR
ncbi:S-locus lectin protein kinase family protein [Euphorbia peplus]|nr:S-locus lectin protein kinase family protein [Euphorbia peplus]